MSSAGSSRSLILDTTATTAKLSVLSATSRKNFQHVCQSFKNLLISEQQAQHCGSASLAGAQDLRILLQASPRSNFAVTCQTLPLQTNTADIGLANGHCVVALLGPRESWVGRLCPALIRNVAACNRVTTQSPRTDLSRGITEQNGVEGRICVYTN